MQAQIFYLFIVLLSNAAAITWNDAGDTVWAMNCDFNGNDLTNVRTTGESCGGTCVNNPQCSHFTWTNYNGGTCWLKKGTVTQQQAVDKTNDGAVCGYLKSRIGGGTGPTGRGKLWGLAYSPMRSSYTCGLTEQQINDDLTKIAQLAKSIRTYGMDCDYMPKIVKLSKQNGLKLLLGLWVDANENTYNDQKTKFENLLKSKPDLSHLIGVNVGNEVLIRGELSESALINKIRDIKSLLQRYGYNTPVTTVEVFVKYSNNLASNVDIVVPNLHSFFAGQPVDNSHNIVFDLVARMKSMAGVKGKTLIVGETGWPSGGSDSRCTQQNEWTYLKNFRCRADREGLLYFYFEAFDAKWKNLGDSNIESHWGLGDGERNLKSGLNDAMKC